MSGDEGATYAEVDSAEVRDKPNLHEHSVLPTNFDVGGQTDVGKTFHFRLEAINVAGVLSSASLGVVLADAPAAPSSGPAGDPSLTSAEQIHFTLGEIDSADPAQTGGSQILSYSLEADDGAGGSFRQLYGLGSDSLSTQYLLREPSMRGKVFRARYRVRNAVGWSDYSPVTSTRAAQRPEAPPLPPAFVAANSASMSLSLTLCEDNGGAAIIRHELWVDDGALGAFSQVLSYDGSSSSFTIEQATETALVSGLIYRLKTRAINAVGASDYTGTTSIALADLPGEANAPAKIQALSTESKLVLSWAPPASSDSPGGDVTGYRLEMDDGLGGDYEVIYDGNNAPSLTTYVVGGSAGAHPLAAGRPYRFRLTARAFNGLAGTSPVAVIYACTAPRDLPAPRLESVTAEALVLVWAEPLSAGSCPLSGYSLYVDDGSSGDPSTPVLGVATDVPTLRQGTVALAAEDLGKTFTLQLTVSNREGTVASPKVSFLFAIAPSQPASGPQILSTSSALITARFDEALPSDGGSPVTSYHLQSMGAYTTGYWRDLVGLDSDSLLTTFTLIGLEKGETYFFRYRAKTVIGWSEFSAPTSAVAADAPAQPATPPVVVGDPTASSVTLRLDLESTDDGGSPITSYALESCQDSSAQDQCLEDAQFTAVASYTGAVQHTLTADDDGLLAGQVYLFRYRATNEVGGSGAASDPVSVAIADKPGAPALIEKVMAYSSKTSLSVEWSAVTVPGGESPGGDVLGYSLYATDPETGTTWEAYNGAQLGLRDVTKTTVRGLTTGKAYRLQVAAHTFNGKGTLSEPFEFRACVLPSPLAAPYRSGGTATTIELHWAPPADTGGCALTGYAVFMDDGTGTGVFAEVNTANDPALRGQPGLNSATITAFSDEEVGTEYVFYL